jgi:hypothetical protein
MSARNPSGLLALAATVALALIAGLFALLARSGEVRRVEPPAASAKDVAAPAPAAPEVVELVPPPRVSLPPSDWNEPTSVLWPCRVELDLIQADYLPTAEAVAPVGTGRAARLSGRIVGAGEVGVAAEIRFTAGPNAGRVLTCDASGAFGAIDLYPGLDIVDVRGPGISGARREVRLRQNAEAQLNLGFGLLASVQGKVVNQAGEALRGARVSFDGRETYSGEDGGFYVSALAGGPCVVEVELEGYSTLLSIESVSAGRDLGPPVVLTLREAATLSISTPAPAGGPGPTLVYVLQSSPARLRVDGNFPQRPTRYPWYKHNPIEVQPSESVVLDDLPPEAVKVYAFRPGASAREQVVNLRSDRPSQVSINLQAAPLVTGVVTLDGQPLPGALVTLEAPDQVRANLGFLTQPSSYLEYEVMPYLPPARQSVRTNQEGRFVLTDFSGVADVRYLEARGPNSSWAGQLVKPGDERVDLVLKSVELGDSEVVIDFPGRQQGLPLEIVVNGAPKDPRVLPPFENLSVGSLLAGRWRLRITWNGELVLEVPDFKLKGEQDFDADLPPGAILGQDEDAWRRAGRDWPF